MANSIVAHFQYQLLPDLTPEEYETLKEDIRARGVQVPVEYDEQGNILDGHHRVRACTELSIKDWPRVVRLGFSEDEKREHVLALNLDRRHLTREQRAELVARLRGEGWSTRRIADRLKVSQPTVLRDMSGDTDVSPQEVTGSDGKTYPAQRQERPKTAALFNPPAREWDFLTHAPQEQRAVLVDKLTSGDARTLSEARRQATVDQAVRAYLPTGKYRVIYADPPWRYGNTMPQEFVEQSDHYATMTMQDICALPIRELADDNAVLFLWVTSPILAESFQVMDAWGFQYKSSFVWDKVKHVMGHYNSVRHELLLVGVRGSCQPDVHKLFDSVVSEERTEHSRKPETFRTIIDTLYTWGARIELFAREKHEGWETFGNEL